MKARATAAVETVAGVAAASADSRTARIIRCGPTPLSTRARKDSLRTARRWHMKMRLAPCKWKRETVQSDNRASSPTSGIARNVPFAEALGVWVRIALLSFGGPAGQIAVMHRILVDEKKWIDEPRFLHALNYCMLLPGPEAQQLVTYIGWLLHGVRGGLVAGTLFILPGFLAIMALSIVYVLHGDSSVVEGLFFGLKAAVLAIVVQAVIRLSSRALKTPAMRLLAAVAFLGIFAFRLPFPLIVLGAAAIGLTGGWRGSAVVRAGGQDEGAAFENPGLGRSWQRALRVLVTGLVVWLAPVAALHLAFGSGNVFAAIGLFFSKMAVVTFGGAYAALAYVAQQAVGTYGWLRPGEMLDGLGMAETTPGPLIMVVQFVAFMGAFRAAGALDPVLAAMLGATLATWVTFAPCFLWIFLGAPHVEALRGNRALSGALAAITAAVVGVILNLAIWFALHTIFAEQRPMTGFGLSLDMPVLSSLRAPELVAAILAFVAVFGLRLGLATVLTGAAAAGIVWMNLS